MRSPGISSPTNGDIKEDYQGESETTPQNNTSKFITVGLLRWLGTAILAVLFYLDIFFHQGRTLTSGEKTIFDSLVVAISLALGLNSAASLRHIAIYAKRWFEGRRHVAVKDIEVHSFVALVQLLFRTPVPLLKVACVLWLLLNFAIQAAIATIGLTFKAEPGIQEIYLDSTLGEIAIPDMSRFARVGRFTDGSRPQSVAAHILGDIGTSYEFSNIPQEIMTNAPIAKHPYAFWDGGDHWEYVFTKSAPVPGSQEFNFLSVYSDEHVKSSATCRTPPYTFTLSGGVLTVTPTDGQNHTVLFPARPLGDESIMYLTESVLRNASANATGQCGPGCATVRVVEPRTAPAAENPESVSPGSTFYYYECNITVAPERDRAGVFGLAPTTAAVAAQAVALSDSRAPSAVNGTPGAGQYTAYTLGLELGQPQNNNATAMARTLSRFAIGVVAAAARTNPTVLVQGYPPRQGLRLVLDKPAIFGGILAATVGVQLVLLAGAVILVRLGERGGEKGSRDERSGG